jgi:hypothetical protein
MFSPLLAGWPRRSFQRTLHCRRAEDAQNHRATSAQSVGSSLRAIATVILPQIPASAVLAGHQAQRLVQPGSLEAGAPFQRGLAASIGKSPKYRPTGCTGWRIGRVGRDEIEAAPATLEVRSILLWWQDRGTPA